MIIIKRVDGNKGVKIELFPVEGGVLEFLQESGGQSKQVFRGKRTGTYKNITEGCQPSAGIHS
jgi:hypothetical protein